MSSAIDDEQQAAPATQPEPPVRRTPRRRLVWGGALAVGLAAIAAFAWWVTHPSVFDGREEAGWSDLTPLESPDRPVYTGQTVNGTGSPDIIPLSAEARISTTWGAATANVLICTHSGELYVGSSQEPDRGDDRLGTGPEECAALRPIDGEPLAENEELVVQVWPEEPRSIVVIEGIGLTYSVGMQRGTQTIATNSVLLFPEADPID